MAQIKRFEVLRDNKHMLGNMTFSATISPQGRFGARLHPCEISAANRRVTATARVHPYDINRRATARLVFSRDRTARVHPWHLDVSAAPLRRADCRC